MAAQGASEAIPIVLVAGGLVTILGHDMTFWIVVLSATVLKMITSEKSTKEGWALIREKVVSFLGAVIPPFVATKGLASWLEVTDDQIILLIAVLLVIMGEGLVRWLVKASSEPTKFIDLLKAWRGGGK